MRNAGRWIGLGIAYTSRLGLFTRA
jgi:hypothetical protein